MRAMFGRRHGGSRGGDAASANSGRSGRSGGYSASAGSGAEQSSIQLDQTSACTSWTEDGEEDGTRSAFVAATNPAPAVLAADEASVEHLQRERTRSTLRDRAREAGKALDDPTQEPAARHAHPAAPRLAASRAAARVHGDASANSNPEPCGALGDVPAAHSASAHNTSVLALIEEDEHAPAHNRDSLCGIISRYNSNDYGQIGELLEASSIGLAMANVPNSSVMFTSRPLAAAWTRWQMVVFAASIGGFLLLAPLDDVLSMWGSSRTMRRLRVHAQVYENVFPDLSRQEDVPGNRRLRLIDAGVYVDNLNRRQVEGCEMNVTSASSFELSCSDSILVHGFWLQVGGSTRIGAPENPDRPFYDYAGILYSYSLSKRGEDATGFENDVGMWESVPDADEVYNVMGTGSIVRGKIWQIERSLSSAEGIFRIPTGTIPLLSRSWKEIVDVFAYTTIAVCLLIASVLSLLGKIEGATQFSVASSVAAAAFFALIQIKGMCDIVFAAAEQRDLQKVLYGWNHYKVLMDSSCEGVPTARNCLSKYGLDTAYLIAGLNLGYMLIWFLLAYFMNAEALLKAFSCSVPVGVFELVLFVIHPSLCNVPIAFAAILSTIAFALGGFLQLRVCARLEAIMKNDNAFYNLWWHQLRSDEANLPALAELQHRTAQINEGILLRHTASGAETGTNGLVQPPTLEHQMPPTLRGGQRIGTSSDQPSGVRRRVGCCVEVLQVAVSKCTSPPPAMPLVRQLSAATTGSVDVSRFFRHNDLHLENRCDFYLNYSAHPSLRTFSQRQGRHGLKACSSLDMLYQQAACLRPILQRKMEAFVGSCHNVALVGAPLQTPLKDPVRAVQKVLRVYGGDCSRLLDICREFVVFQRVQDLVAMLERLQNDPDLVIMRIKNRLDPNYDTSASAYRDVMVNLRIENSETVSMNVQHHIVELQLIPQAVYERRTEGLNKAPGEGRQGDEARMGFNGHMNYVLWRDLRGR